MKSANGIPYSYILDLFIKGHYVDETNFYFEGELSGDNHYLGYLPEVNPDTPYWAGHCDLQDGFECATAEELFNTPYYDKRTLKERWKEIHIYEIGLVPIEQFVECHNDEYPINSYN